MHQPRKRFGQHFLHDPGVIGRIVAAIAPQPQDRMVEIGPGLGALTLPLLARLSELHAVEIDRDAIRHLHEITHNDHKTRPALSRYGNNRDREFKKSCTLDYEPSYHPIWFPSPSWS